MRREEYKRHPLFKILALYSEELQEYIQTKLKRHEQMKEAAERMNLGPGAHYNPISGTYIRANQIDTYRQIFKPYLTPIGRPNTFLTSKILANSPILDLSVLQNIQNPSSRAKYLCKKLEQLYKPSDKLNLEPQRSTTTPAIQILSVEQK